ncbi:membrane protein [Streptomyces puniciscabiei]|uniref:Membrane protein n=1 Tax=Streptomyces puniciscabiei TaxID=164348 RepID=A0A542SZT9_9ACTN|nr:YhjD/YihY/BrkB family envelope integrity protein [Streptomyces puniciscabiei]TQK80078.1 membrane protein [Streptomyces puniciscabiei]
MHSWRRSPGKGRGTTLCWTRLDHAWQAAGRRFEASAAGRLWGRLSAADFFGHSFQLASLAFLCFFPFLILVTAAFGQDAAHVMAGWLGLNEQAAQAVAGLFKPNPGSVTLTLMSALLLIAGAVAVAGTLQGWYQFLFGVPPRWWRDLGAQLAWLAVLVAYGAARAGAGAALGSQLSSLAGFVLALFFWWGTMRLLLTGAIAWRFLLPAALATGVAWTGLGWFSSRFFSDTIVANNHKYGPVGVVMVILSWLVAVGVVIHLGAVVGHEFARHRAMRSHR